MKLLELLDEDPNMTVGERLRNRLAESGNSGVHLTQHEAKVLCSMLSEHYGDDPFIKEPFLTAEHLKAMGLEATDLDVAKGLNPSSNDGTAPPVEAPPQDNIPQEVEAAQASLDNSSGNVSEEDRKAAALLIGAASNAGWGKGGEDPLNSTVDNFGVVPTSEETKQVTESVFKHINKARRERYKNQPVQSRDAASIVGVV